MRALAVLAREVHASTPVHNYKRDLGSVWGLVKPVTFGSLAEE